jgi:outer membrane protein assembly factor BamE (lipoprotein component of BamABCDE complex)
MRKAWLCSLLAAVLTLPGCDSQKIAELEEGVATEADVRARFGTPAAIYEEPNGDRTLEYPRQPEGQTNYMISIGPDGRMSSLRQVLKPANFAKVTPGTDKTQVRRLLGKPAKTQFFKLKNEEVWDWRYVDGQESRIFSATFDGEGRVVSTGTVLDPKYAGP